MKYKIFIAKALAIGIVLNSLSVLSYANTEIPNRYQTLEGEYITIDDSIEGNLEDIEIFGNTVQDENNLEDIQSVGDLYTDKDGNPILDSQGREQYKINIISQNKNLLYSENVTDSWKNGLTYTYDNNNVEISGTSSYYESLDLATGKVTKEIYSLGLDERCKKYAKDLRFNNLKGGTYTLSADVEVPQPIGRNGLHAGVYVIYDDEKQIGITPNLSNTASSSASITFTVESHINTVFIGSWYAGVNFDGTKVKNIQLELNNSKTDFENSLYSSQTILLPVQLQKVGDIADRLYWDRTKNRYVINKVILKDIKKDVLRVSKLVENETHIVYRVMLPREEYPTENTLFSLKKIDYNCDNLGETGYGTFYTDSTFYIKLSVPKDENIIDFINLNSFIYANGDTEIMESNITQKLNIPTYNKKTLVYTESENGVNPTLKLIVDRLPQIAKSSIEEAEINSSINNIALARMYVNMLPESLYKDQLQEQLSEIFSSDVVLDKKSATANLDLYIKCENILQMSLNTNSITFEDFSGVEDTEKVNAVEITINSSLPYSLNAYLPTEIQNGDKSNIMNKSILNIKENSESVYQAFANTTDKIVLKDNCNAGNDLIHNIDIKLKGGIAHQKDVYKTTIKFEAQQK